MVAVVCTCECETFLFQLQLPRTLAVLLLLVFAREVSLDFKSYRRNAKVLIVQHLCHPVNYTWNADEVPDEENVPRVGPVKRSMLVVQGFTESELSSNFLAST